jgi:hypothetical protein
MTAASVLSFLVDVIVDVDVVVFSFAYPPGAPAPPTRPFTVLPNTRPR